MNAPFPNSASAPSACRASKRSTRSATASNSATATSTPPRSTATRPRSARRCRNPAWRADEVFVTTKIWTENLAGDKLIASLKDSLHKLRLEQLDLTLIHWPSPQGAVPVAESMQALLEAREQGLTGAIGVSNFTNALLAQAIAAVGAAEHRHQPGRAASLPAEPQRGRLRRANTAST
jgi:hypothetical protein